MALAMKVVSCDGLLCYVHGGSLIVLPSFKRLLNASVFTLVGNAIPRRKGHDREACYHAMRIITPVFKLESVE